MAGEHDAAYAEWRTLPVVRLIADDDDTSEAWGEDELRDAFDCAWEAGRVAGLKAAHAAMVDAVEDANAALRALEEMGA